MNEGFSPKFGLSGFDGGVVAAGRQKYSTELWAATVKATGAPVWAHDITQPPEAAAGAGLDGPPRATYNVTRTHREAHLFESDELDRRTFMLGALGVAASAATSDAAQPAAASAKMTGRLKQSVCQWCYDKIPLDDLCRAAAGMGLKSVELLSEKQWNVPKSYGLTCAMANGPCTIKVGFNRPAEHDRLVEEGSRLLQLVARDGLPNMIVFSGNRDGMSDSEGLANCAVGLKRLTPLAEQLGVTVCMELLNSKVDHHDYMCDHTPWGAELVKRVNSPRFKLLYDIYHMQIMEGDVIHTIRDNFAHIAHFHTGGVPGRAEIDETQELFYPAVCRAILDLGFAGYLAQEFVPVRDPLVSLRQGATICDV